MFNIGQKNSTMKKKKNNSSFEYLVFSYFYIYIPSDSFPFSLIYQSYI